MEDLSPEANILFIMTENNETKDLILPNGFQIYLQYFSTSNVLHN